MPDFFHTRFGNLPSGVAAGMSVQVHKDLLVQALKNRGLRDSPTNTNGEQIIINLDKDDDYDFHITFQAITGQQIWFDRAHFCIRKEGPGVEDREYNSVIYWWYKFVINGVVVPKTTFAPVQIKQSAFDYSFATPLAGGGTALPDMVAAVEVDNTHTAYNTSQSGILDNLITDMKKAAKDNWLYYKKNLPAIGWKIGPKPT